MSDTERTFDWQPRFDERSRSFPVAAAIGQYPRRRNKLWRSGITLDQGPDGACVGFGWAAEALAPPVKVDLNRVAAGVPTDPTRFAHGIYRKAQTIDEWEGENYDGTSVLAGAKTMKDYGLLKEYRWAFTIEQLADAILAKGPAVIGVWWYDGMFDAPEGVLNVSGNTVGGHCVLVVGYLLPGGKAPLSDLQNPFDEDAFIIQNSWGNSWGKNGLAVIRKSQLGYLLADDGEACVPVRRSYGRGPNSLV